MMSALVTLVLLSVPLQAPFVVAEASAVQIEGDSMWVEATVETTRSAAVVLVRASGPDNQPLEPVAMEQREGSWTARMFLPRRSDIRLSFEHIDPEGFSFVSRPVALIELGVDAAVFGLGDERTAARSPADGPERNDGRSRWLWLAVGLVSAAGAVLLIAFGLRPQPELGGDD